QNVFSGAALTYLIPRFSLYKLLSVSGIWNVLVSFSFPILLVSYDLFPEIYLQDLILLSLILGFIGQIQSSLLGYERILKQNMIEITRAVTLALSYFLIIGVYKNHS